MTAVPVTVFEHNDVRLRVWFNDGTIGFQHITPDQRIASAGYAITAGSVALSSIYAAPAQWVVAWGENGDGQTTVPPALTNVAQIAAGTAHCLARKSDGTIVAWGRDAEGQATVPPAATGITSIAAGSFHSLAVKSDGTVLGWGANEFGQRTIPPAATGVAQVAAGEHHSLARKTNGTLVAWGDNSFTQTTIPPAAATGIISIACGNDHCLALKNDGTVVAWGRNETGQSTVPPGLTGVTAIAAGAFHSLALKSDGTVVAWGWNLGGQSTVPPGLTGVVSIAGGYSHSVAAKNDGSVVPWGDNFYEQQSIPANTNQIIAVSARGNFTLALRNSTVPASLARLDTDNVFHGKIGIGRVPETNALEVEGQASRTTAGNWLANSDRRIKTEVQPVTGALQKLDKVRLVDFRYSADYLAAHPGIADQRYLNVIAQEFGEVFPEHVRGSGEKLPDGSEILQVDTYPLTIYSAAAIQELHRENEALKKQIASQDERLRKLEALLNQ
jgi:hypothetical protein